MVGRVLFGQQAQPTQPVTPQPTDGRVLPIQPETAFKPRLSVPQFQSPFLGGGATEDTGLVEAITGRERSTPEIEALEEIGDAPELNEFSLSALKTSFGLLTTGNIEELKKILKKQVPSAKFRQDSKGNEIVDFPSRSFALNKPGLSGQDLAQGLFTGAAFALGGEFALGAKTAIGAITKGAVGAGTTQAAIEGGQVAVGGEFDIGEVALAAAAGGGAEAIGPAIRAARAPFQEIPEQAARVIAAGERARVPVLTTDVIPPETFAGRALQQTAEKIPIIGTGGVRAEQQRLRSEAVEEALTEFDVGLDTEIERDIIRSLSETQKAGQKRAITLRNESVDSLNTFGTISAKSATKKIDDQVKQLSQLKERSPTALINLLEDTKSALNQEGINFGLMTRVRSEVIKDIKKVQRGEHEVLSSVDEGVLQSIKRSIDNDLKSFAKQNNREAAAKFSQSNRLFADEFTKFKNTELRTLLAKGELTPERVAPVLRGGKLSELKRLNANLTEPGRKAARTAIMRDILEKARIEPRGFDPDIFAREMKKPNIQRAISAFFKDTDKKQLDGLRKLLAATTRAKQAGVTTPTGQALIPLIAFGGAAADAVTTGLTATTLSAAARAYESNRVRNALLKFAATKENTPAFERLIRESQPLINVILQIERQQGGE